MKPTPPTGQITFLFTDIEGSTRLWELEPEAMKTALRRHDAILREAIDNHGGFVFKTVGDAFDCAFGNAAQAIAAALDGQRLLAAEGWASGIGSIRVRMALHAGPADERDGDYFGPTLNRVARLLSAGHGGQVLLSGQAADLVRENLPARATLIDLGTHRLKDLVAPVAIYQLSVEGLSEDFPPLHTLDRVRHNLPVQPTPLVGRRPQVDAIIAMLRSPDIRLVTLTGVGGTGKTRLSLQVAAEVMDEYEHGVFFVDLAQVTEPEAIAPAVIDALGIAAPSREDPQAVLEKYVAGRQMLLILDNFEQVIRGAPLVTALLRVAGRLEVIVTSRELLRISAEHVFSVPPLTLPEISPLSLPVDFMNSEAVTLFLNRAQAARGDFHMTGDNARAVAEISIRLDGLPLAIELAAARVRLFSPQALLDRLGDRLDVLGRGMRDRPERQQTLSATIDWSYNLLDEAEQTLFRRLAVFSGGWDLGMVSAVCGAGLSMDVFEGLESLLNKSLIRRVEEPASEPRFTMLVTIAEYAGDKLTDSGEGQDIRRRHAAYFHDIAIEAAGQLRARRQVYWLNRLDLELDNLRTALNFLLDGDDISRGIQMATALRDYWLYSYKHLEGENWLRRALALAGQLDKAIYVDALTAAGMFLEYRNKLDESIVLLDEAQALAAEMNDPRQMAWIGMWRAMAGPLDENEVNLKRARESIDTLRSIGDLPGLAQALNICGEILRSHGDLPEAEAIYREIIPVAEKIGDIRRVILQYANLSMIAYDRGDVGAMLHYSRLGLPLSLEYRVEETAMILLLITAIVSHRHGRSDSAACFLGASDAWYLDTSVMPQPTDAPIEAAIRKEIRRDMDSKDFDRGWKVGRAWSLPEAVEKALEEIAVLENLFISTTAL